MSTREDDLEMLKTLLDEHVEELSEAEVEAFADMRFNMTAYEKAGGQDTAGSCPPSSASGSRACTSA